MKKKHISIGLAVAALLILVYVLLGAFGKANKPSIAAIGYYEFNEHNRMGVFVDENAINRMNNSVKTIVYARLENNIPLPNAKSIAGFQSEFIADCDTGRAAFQELRYFDQFGERLLPSEYSGFLYAGFGMKIRDDTLAALCPNLNPDLY